MDLLKYIEEEVKVTEQLEGLIDNYPKEIRKQMLNAILQHILENAESLNKCLNKKDYVLDVYRQADKEVKGTVEKYKTTCKKGCAFCCHIEVKTTITEAEIIMDRMEQQNEPFTEDELAMLERQSKLSSEEYSFNPDRACVFLTDDNECSIYDIRPLACRTYLVATPPEHCDALLYRKVKGVMVAASIHSELMRSVLYTGLESGRLSELLLKLQRERHGNENSNNATPLL